MKSSQTHLSFVLLSKLPEIMTGDYKSKLRMTSLDLTLYLPPDDATELTSFLSIILIDASHPLIKKGLAIETSL